MKYPQTFENLINGLKKLPGVGLKSAERMAYQILEMDEDDLLDLADSLTQIKKKICKCSRCGNMAEGDLCEVCLDSSRDSSLICVVSSSKDVFALEKAKNFNGLYHVLGGVISPQSGVGIQDLNIDSLLRRIDEEKVEELIIATNPNIEGETTALYLAKLLEDKDVEISRLAYGLPVGADLVYADEYTLIKALQGRRKLK